MEQLFQLCLNHQISPNQLYLLFCFKRKVKPPLINTEAELFICKQKGLITTDGKLSYLAESILADCESYFKKTKAKAASDVLGDNYQAKVKLYREMFPAMTHPTLNYPFRVSIEDLTPRFVWFFDKYPDYNWDLVLKVTKKFIDKAAENNYSGLGKCNYFVQKKIGTTIQSTLADLCETELETGGKTDYVEDFYTTM